MLRLEPAHGKARPSYCSRQIFATMQAPACVVVTFVSPLEVALLLNGPRELKRLHVIEHARPICAEEHDALRQAGAQRRVTLGQNCIKSVGWIQKDDTVTRRVAQKANLLQHRGGCVNSQARGEF